MSLDATIWVWKTKITAKKGGALAALKKLVLLSMADRADEQHCCYPSTTRLAEDCGIDRKTVFKVIDELIQDGLISDTGERKGKTKQVIVYRLDGVSGREKTVPTTEQLPPENNTGNSADNGTVPTTEQFQQFNETVPTIPLNSTNSGTRNLSSNLPIESKNKKDWLCLNKLRLELDQADSTVIPKDIIEASWFEREKRAFELFNAGNNLCDDLLFYHFYDTLLKNYRLKYNKTKKSKSIDSDFIVFASLSQMYLFANKLAKHSDVINKFSAVGESHESFVERIAKKLADPEERQNWKEYLIAVGFKSKGVAA
ncbi:helix-turn-helix domain-containing protein [Acinetobacter bereziniae]|uniref:helix-turn-helix domain-containing protein n=1 Tax=Acinetobacter bereziniae TaxID=106648 RepID=UPI0021D14388|nr:helix-turn-helix domain-containing protein [Acinetobacter bereziniae]MCU4436120.1 helix-turn-helix domain-containing protein [Acinetobacter bereziniae]